MMPAPARRRTWASLQPMIAAACRAVIFSPFTDCVCDMTQNVRACTNPVNTKRKSPGQNSLPGLAEWLKAKRRTLLYGVRVGQLVKGSLMPILFPAARVDCQ